MKVITKQLIIILAVGGCFLFGQAAGAAMELIKSVSSPTVYYLDSQGVRHPFPNFVTYKSWYGDDFSRVVILSDELIAKYPLGRNITIRPGKFLVKVPSSPKVYAVEQGGVLRHIELEAVAEAIYKEGWQRKVIDLPEVFFNDYTIGESLEHDYEIPDSIVYKVKNESKYYWKQNRVLRPFESVQAVFDNGYSLDEVITSNRMFYARSSYISGKDKRINNLVAKPVIRRSDCANKNLRAAFIFVSQSNYKAEQLEKIEKIKEELPKSFFWATDELAKIEVGYPTVLFLDDGNLVTEDDEGKHLTHEVSFDFYDEHSDEFDFLIIFTNFKVMKNDEQANFVQITNRVAGINGSILDASEVYGSGGKLKGIITMGNIDKYEIGTTRGMNTVQNYLLHEILHQWAAGIKFLDEDGQYNYSLLREPDLIHWSYYVGFISPIGGSGWQDNSDGTFTSLLSQMDDSNKKPYSKLDLYLMGLLPAQVIEPIMYVVPAIPNVVGNTIKGTAKYVTINQIIEANGKWSCEEE